MLCDLVRYRTTLSRQLAQRSWAFGNCWRRRTSMRLCRSVRAARLVLVRPSELRRGGEPSAGPYGGTAGVGEKQLAAVDLQIEGINAKFPQTSGLTVLKGIGLCTARVVVAEFGDVSISAAQASGSLGGADDPGVPIRGSDRGSWACKAAG